MDLNTANQLAENVMQTCQKASKPAAVTVLDQGGNVLASQRHESVGIHNLTASQRKAFTAYSTKTSTLDFMRHRLLGYQEATGNNYNLEATPAEGTTYRLAQIDRASFPETAQFANGKGGNTDRPFYTNSTHLPVNASTENL